MRGLVTQELTELFFKRIGESVKERGTIFLNGGATALFYGARQQTLDIDLKIDLEPKGIFEAIAILKEEIQINIELASPDQFLPPLPGWRERSIFIGIYGNISFYHYDLYSQVLSKIERGHGQDLLDVDFYFKKGLVEKEQLKTLFSQIESECIRYPAIDIKSLKKKLEQL
jgi:hypothetical protein